MSFCMAGQGEEKPRRPPPPPTMVTTTGYWYSDPSSGNMMNLHMPQQSCYEQNNHHHHHHDHHQDHQEICYNTGMEMMGWKGFLNKAGGSSKTAGISAGGDQFYHSQDFSTWVDPQQDAETSSSLICVFPCEGNERPSQGLSLSLSSSNPSAIGLQSFELRATPNPVGLGAEFLGKPAANLSRPSIPSSSGEGSGYFLQIRNSKYLGAAQELLNEFCSLGTSESSNLNHHLRMRKKTNHHRQWEDDGCTTTAHDSRAAHRTSDRNPSFDSVDLLELHKTKAKLLQMLQEVDRRYQQYCDEMKAVVSSLEAVAGDGAAKGYTALAAKAMSRHFRCLRDGIMAQLKAIKKATVEKDSTAAAAAAAGTTKGETPRLKILDQALRQQRSFQQMSMMEAHPWRPQRGLPERSVSVLRAWLFEHFLHPYPSDVDKHILARQTGLSRSQVSNWFINARVRLWKPMVEEMYLEETKEEENLAPANSSDDYIGDSDGRLLHPHHNPNAAADAEDHKPNLVRIDISSVVNNNPNDVTFNNDDNKADGQRRPNSQDHHQIFGTRGGDHRSFFGPGLVEDFSPSSYAATQDSGGAYNYAVAGGGGGVSLTLGLQQQGGGGMSLDAPSSSLFYPRDQMEECQTGPYPLLDNEGQNLPYRNLIGAQLLRDLAG
ncbi:unnamed protein product [Cuscuta epithymum]|uniref:Homeobox domain-containing protein n=1 Tax=Cuscuta epithymum TaxID=186058 RepID=A0AAV0D2T9_9ASTE|nr:unnamed protein product [Cuscuta epithymum]